MFAAIFNKAAKLKQIVDSIKDLIDYCNIECIPTGMKLQAMDSSRVCLVDLFLESQSPFIKEYIFERPVSMGLNMSLLSNVIGVAKSDEPIAIKCEQNCLVICFEDPYTEVGIPLIDIQVETPDVPDGICQGFHINLDSSEFNKVVNTERDLADQLILDVSENTVKMMVDNNNGTGGVSWSSHELVEHPARLLLSSRHMGAISKASVLTKEVTLWIGEAFVVDYQMKDVGYLKFYLAPQYE